MKNDLNEQLLAPTEALKKISGLKVKCVTYDGLKNTCVIVFSQIEDNTYTMVSLLDVFHVVDHGLSNQMIRIARAQELGHGYFHTAEILKLNPDLYSEIIFFLENEDQNNIGLVAACKSVGIIENAKTFMFPDIESW